jgi:hypothetical protein
MSQGNWIPMVNRSLKEINSVYFFQMSGHSTALCHVPEQSPLLQQPQNLCVLSFSCPIVLTTVGWGFLLHYLSGTDSYMARVCCLFFRVVWEAFALIVYFRIICSHLLQHISVTVIIVKMTMNSEKHFHSNHCM